MRGGRRTDTDIADKLLEPIASEHLAKHLLRVMQLILRSAILLPELVVLVSQFRIGEDLICDRDLLELYISFKFGQESKVLTFSSASGSSRFLSGCNWHERRSRERRQVAP